MPTHEKVTILKSPVSMYSSKYASEGTVSSSIEKPIALRSVWIWRARSELDLTSAGIVTEAVSCVPSFSRTSPLSVQPASSRRAPAASGS